MSEYLADLEEYDSSEAQIKNYERVRNLKKYDPNEFRNNFLELLCKDKNALQNIIDGAYFYINKHSIHKTCPSGDKQCDFCYSADTEFDAKYTLEQTIKKLWLKSYELTPLVDYDGASAEESNE